MIFGEYSDIVENDILIMQRFLDVSRFLYSRVWQAGTCINTHKKLNWSRDRGESVEHGSTWCLAITQIRCMI